MLPIIYALCFCIRHERIFFLQSEASDKISLIKLELYVNVLFIL